jgi:hypothetical protein
MQIQSGRTAPLRYGYEGSRQVAVTVKVPEEGLAFFPQLGEESVRQPLEPSHVLRRDAVPELSKTIARILTTGPQNSTSLVFNTKRFTNVPVSSVIVEFSDSIVIIFHGSPSATLLTVPGLPYKNQTKPPG